MEDSTSQLSFHEESIEENKRDGRSKWTNEQDAYIQDLVETYGNKDWNIISNALNQKFTFAPRTSNQCRLRWKKLNHNLPSKHSWTEKEEAELLLAHRTYKNSWSDISNALHGRVNNTIKNRFYTIFRKVKNKIKKFDYSYTSQCELLQIHYMISVMESYMSTMANAESANEMAGKDFVFKLVQQIDKKTLETYSKKFNELTAPQGTMQDLFQAVINGTISAEPASIALPEELHEESKTLQNTELNDQPMEMEAMDSTSQIKPKEILMENIVQRESSPFENMILGSSGANPMPKYSPCILSAGPAAAAAAASNAPCFQVGPDDLGFSDFTEGPYQTPIFGSSKGMGAFSPVVFGSSPVPMNDPNQRYITDEYSKLP